MPKVPGRRSAVVAGLALLIGAAAAAARGAPAGVNEQARVLKEFTDRCKEYAKLHGKLASELPKLPDKATPEQIAVHEEALTARIRAARKDARQGDVFTPEASRLLLELVHSEFHEKDAMRVREAIRQDNPKPDLKDPKMRTKPQPPPPPNQVVLAPNTPYPEAEPVSTVPPELFAKLPELPEPLEYRFVGRNLVLRDRAASLIVDFLPKAIPRYVGPR
jgi:hypothetical protein